MAILGDPISGWVWAENEASLSAIMAQKEGFAERRRAGCDFARTHRGSMGKLRELDVPYICALIADRGISKTLKARGVPASHLKRFFGTFLKYCKERDFMLFWGILKFMELLK